MTILDTEAPARSVGDTSTVDERRRRKTAVAVTLRLFGELGFEFGFNGHITVRDPGSEHLFWANPLGVPFRRTGVADLVLVDSAGVVVEGRHPTSVAGFANQYVLHQARPDAVAVVHAHSPYGFTWSSSPKFLEPVSTDAALIHRLQAIHESFGRAPKAQLLLRAAGGEQLLDPALRDRWTLTPEIAEQHFAPHLRQILHDHPDLLDEGDPERSS